MGQELYGQKLKWFFNKVQFQNRGFCYRVMVYKDYINDIVVICFVKFFEGINVVFIFFLVG